MEAMSRDVARHLAARGLLGREALVDGGVAMSASRRRNRFVIVKQRFGPSFFVKQALNSEAMSHSTVEREAGVYRAAFEGKLTPLRGLLPQFHDYDEESGILVTELITGAQTLSDVHAGLGHCPADLARRVGGAMGAYHAIPFTEQDAAGLFPLATPWVLKLDTKPDLDFMRRSVASGALLDLVLQAEPLKESLAALHSGWRPEALIHTDTRWDNFLLAPKHLPLDERRLYVVDWELADLGDPAWDTATMLFSYLAFWIDSIPLNGEATPEELVAGARHPLESVQPAIRAFWQGYCDAHAEPLPAAFLERCSAMIAARMIITMMEISGHLEAIPPRAMVLLQIATNILERPAAAARDLLGIESAQPAKAPPDARPAPRRNRGAKGGDSPNPPGRRRRSAEAVAPPVKSAPEAKTDSADTPSPAPPSGRRGATGRTGKGRRR